MDGLKMHVPLADMPTKGGVGVWLKWDMICLLSNAARVGIQFSSLLFIKRPITEDKYTVYKPYPLLPGGTSHAQDAEWNIASILQPSVDGPWPTLCVCVGMDFLFSQFNIR